MFLAAYKRELIRKQNRETRRSVQGEELDLFFHNIYQVHSPDEITFVCIGTDRSTGDALGPLTGSLLEGKGVGHVIGTMPYPCDADTLQQKLACIPPHQVIIAIDACLGPKAAIGHFYLFNQALNPAESVGGNLPSVGHYSVAAVVNANGPRPYTVLQMTSLHQVMNMSHMIAEAVLKAAVSGQTFHS